MKLFLLTILLSFNCSAITIKGYCGAYASVIKTGTTYEIFSNETPNVKAVCPGSGCPGIVRYYGSLSAPSYYGIVANNSIIDDVFTSTGVLSPNRMFSRPVIAKDGLGYVAISMVMDGYPAVQARPALLTSTNGINWIYRGQLKGEPEAYSLFGSGMALIVANSYPRYRFYSDGYGVKMAGLYSNDLLTWKFIRNTSAGIKELAPPEWIGAVFTSAVEYNGTYYLAASNKWPVTKWQFAHSSDSINWIHDSFISVSNIQKNVSMYIDNSVHYLGTTSLSGTNCYRKTIY